MYTLFSIVILFLSPSWNPSPQSDIPSFQRWGWDGHKMVCAIAWWEMKPETQQRISDLLELDPRYTRFMESCLWADDVRGKQPEYDRWTTAHYVNLPRGATAFNHDRDCGASFCVVDGVNESKSTLINPTSSDADRLVALKFLSHFVGDIHQPMHAGYADDRGGNDTKISLFSKPTNMHGMWDYGLLEHTGREWMDYAASLYFRVSDEDRDNWISDNPETWTEESFAIVSSSAYEISGTEVGQSYYDQHISLVERRIQQAGIRLAHLLDASFSK